MEVLVVLQDNPVLLPYMPANLSRYRHLSAEDIVIKVIEDYNWEDFFRHVSVAGVACLFLSAQPIGEKES